jgi:hypothetical protein
MKIVILIQFVVILIMIFVIIRLSKKLKFLKNQYTDVHDTISGKDLFENITKSKLLYKELLIELHPDRFIANKDLQKKAELLVLELGEYKSSYRNLFRIAEKAKEQGFILSPRFLEKHINNI